MRTTSRFPSAEPVPILPSMDNCPFCDLAAGRTDTDLVIMRTSNVFVVPALKQRQLNRGHMLVVPAAHVTRLIDAEARFCKNCTGSQDVWAWPCATLSAPQE
jgi:hypothetical protein